MLEYGKESGCKGPVPGDRHGLDNARQQTQQDYPISHPSPKAARLLSSLGKPEGGGKA